jgi:hypothetical protein
VIAVIAVIAWPPSAETALMSACIPAPPPESDPAMIRGAVHQLAAAIGAAVVQRIRALGAQKVHSNEQMNAPVLVGGQIDAAAFAIGAHFQHQAATPHGGADALDDVAST